MNRTVELSKSVVLAQLFCSDEISEVIARIKPSHIRDDVKQHVFLLLLEHDEPFIIDLHTRDKLRPYVAKTIYNTARWSQSSFNRQARRTREIPTESFATIPDEETDYDYEALVEACPIKLEKIYWYNRDMLKLYTELGSYRAVEAKTGIPYRSVFDAVRQAKEDMKKLLWE